MNKLTGFIMILIVAALMAVPVSAQTSSEGDQGRITSPFSPTVVPTPVLDEHKIYEIKHQNVVDIAELIPVSVIASAQFNTISLSANPQVHEIVASIIEKHDVPKRTVEFQFFLIKANSSPNDGINNDELPEKVLTALNEVAGLTRYKNFELIAAPILRTREGSNAQIEGGGNRESVYDISINGIGISRDADKHLIRVRSFRTTSSSARINTSFEFTEGEMTVIATSRIPDNTSSDVNSFIVFVTAKVL